MNKAQISILKRKAFFPFLLVLFFVFHGYVEYFPVIPVKDATILFLYYTLIAAVIFLLGYLLLRKVARAAILAFALLCYQFFFGKVQDTLKGLAPGTFITHYVFLVPFSLLAIIFLVIYLKRSGKSFTQTVLFLNIAFLLFIAVDIVLLIPKLTKGSNVASANRFNLARCTNCETPDIYLVVADAYAGKQELADLFHFDNTPFEEALKKRGFHVIDSTHSNYNFTAFSMASMLQMTYLEGIKGVNSDKEDVSRCFSLIKQNPFVDYLKQQGYEVFNYSIFDLEGNPSVTRATFLPLRTKYITSQTFTNRLMRDLGYHLATTFRIPSVIRKYKYSDLTNNEKIFDLTLKRARVSSSNPKFVYSHLMMPHHPFYFDSIGNRIPLSKLEDNYFYDKEMRISYLKYSNRKFLQLIDSILKVSARTPIILFLGDHGFREFREKVDDRYIYMNLVAILLPNGKYESFPNGMTNVNLLRGLLNQQFRQQLSLLPDSTFFIRE